MNIGGLSFNKFNEQKQWSKKTRCILREKDNLGVGGPTMKPYFEWVSAEINSKSVDWLNTHTTENHSLLLQSPQPE